MIKINDTWSIEHHIHGGFNLIEQTDSVGKKGQPIKSKRSYYYPNLRLCADKMVEQSFDSDAESLTAVVNAMALFSTEICNLLEGFANE